jgi:hypothetical protein
MKLKKLLNENLWNERKFGEPLPTLEDTTRVYKLKQEDLNEKVSTSDKDVKKVSSLLGKSPKDVAEFVNKYDGLDADDLLDVLDTARAEPHHIRRYSLMVMAAMRGNRRALKGLDQLFGFMG